MKWESKKRLNFNIYIYILHFILFCCKIKFHIILLQAYRKSVLNEEEKDASELYLEYLNLYLHYLNLYKKKWY